MKKLVWGIGILCSVGILWSCEDTPENPGDFNAKAELSMGTHFWALSDPSRTYPLEIDTRRDTTYKYRYTINDTVFEYFNDGKDSTYVYDEHGKPLVNVTDSFYFSSKTAELIVMKPIYLENYSDTVMAQVFTNARWTAKQPAPSGTEWLYNYNSTEAGGGDSEFGLRTDRFRGAKKRGPLYQYVFTSDSMICVKIPVYQKGREDYN